ncbi:hypothetical protein BKI52_20360 [marine bacterium AO1-C]|nr:hypothetical protein BKI52_20360 [marine bacterium AO1-C]
MNIKDNLIQISSKENAESIAQYVGADPDRFAELMALFLGDEYRLTQRAAWVLSKSVDRHPQLLLPYLEKVIYNLQEDVPVAVKRNTVRILQDVDIPEDLMGPLADVCFQFLESGEEPIAVKVFSMTILFNITKKEPDLKNELRLLIEAQLPYGSAGFKSRAKKILPHLQ